MIGWTDTDDRDRHAFHPNHASNDGGVGAEQPGPCLMSQDGDDWSPAPLLRGVEPATERRLQSENVEVRRGRVLDDGVAYNAIIEIAWGGFGMLAAIVPAKMSVYSAISI